MASNPHPTAPSAARATRDRMLCALAALVLLAGTASAQTAVFGPPLEGVRDRDFFIVNYVDHDTTAGLRDYECGTRTYDGHTGIDFAIRSFPTMDSGVRVTAAAAGRVFAVIDTACDRNKRVDPPLGFGNYIGIAHAGGLYTYYGHIRRGSAMVQVGDSVRMGTPIALVGSAGNSTDPHVHFEVWNDSELIDPFSGACNTRPSLWIQQWNYDHPSRLIDHGLFSWTHGNEVLPTIDTLRERPQSRHTYSSPGDSMITFWTHMTGVAAGDTSSIHWLDSSGNIYFAFDYIHPVQSQFEFFWAYILTPPAGRWALEYTVHGLSVADSFTVAGPAGVAAEPRAGLPSVRYDERNAVLDLRFAGGPPMGRLRATLFASNGARLCTLYDGPPTAADLRLPLADCGASPGLYFVEIAGEHNRAAVPIMITRR